MKKKLAIISTHPIQYNAPLFRKLAQSDDIEIHVFYTWSQSETGVKDVEFGKEIVWDIPLLDGYQYTFVENVSTYPRKHFKGLKNPKLIPLIEKWGADAVWVFGWNFQSHLKAMRHFKGRIPVYFRGDSTLLNETGGLKTMMRRIALTWVYSYVDVAFYVGTNNKEYFRKHGLKESQLCLAPHAIDNDRFADDQNKQYEEKARQWKNELGYDDKDIVLLYTGKFIGVKNITSLIRLFNEFCRLHKEAPLHLLLIGNGELESELRSISGLNNKIRFLPFQNQSIMPVVYRLGDILIMPSVSETWGLGINEAMACGRAAMASRRVGCAVDMIKEPVSGWIYDLDDEAHNLLLLESWNKEILAQIGANNRNWINQWSFDAIVSSVIKTMIHE